MNFVYSTEPKPILLNLMDGFKLFKQSFPDIAPFVIAKFCMEIFFAWVEKTEDQFAIFLVTVIVSCLDLLILSAIIWSAHEVATGKPISLSSSLKKVSADFVQLLIGFVIYCIFVLAGLILFIVPGLVIMISAYWFVPLILLDGYSGLESIKKSRDLCAGYWWKSFATIAIPSVISLAMHHLLTINGQIQDDLKTIVLALLTTFFVSYLSVLALIHLNELKLRQN